MTFTIEYGRRCSIRQEEGFAEEDIKFGRSWDIKGGIQSKLTSNGSLGKHATMGDRSAPESDIQSDA
jgi:hypothetical protein